MQGLSGGLCFRFWGIILLYLSFDDEPFINLIFNLQPLISVRLDPVNNSYTFYNLRLRTEIRDFLGFHGGTGFYNGLYLEMQAIAGTKLHRKSEHRIYKMVPKPAV